MNSTSPDNPRGENVSLAEIARELQATLQTRGDEAYALTQLLLMHVTGCSRPALLADPDRALDAAACGALRAAARRCAAGEPLAYVAGEAGFYGRAFAVDEHVLIPRPETEHLIDEVLARSSGVHAVCDVGTGSGAIAVTLACELPHASVTAVDISLAALAVAQRNARRHQVAGRIRFVHGDLLAAFAAKDGAADAAGAPFDVVVANLPYIPSANVPRRPDPVGWEPVLALDGGEDGLDLYRRLFEQLPPLLTPDAVILCEAAPPTIAGLARLLEASFAPERRVEIKADYAGLHRYAVSARP